MRNSPPNPHSTQNRVPPVSLLRPGIRSLLSKGLVFVAVLQCGFTISAQTASQAWLKYHPLSKPLTVPMRVSPLGQSLLEQTAAIELRRGLLSLSGGTPLESGPNMIELGTVQELRKQDPKQALPSLEQDEFLISAHRGDLIREIDIIGGSDRAILYGAFALLRNLAQGNDMSKVNLRERPAMSIRWVDEWDNADGSIERGYAGRSIFFDDGHVREDLAPVGEYARLLASIGIDGCNLNNVNNAAVFLTPQMLEGIARIAETMRPYGVRVSLSVDIASPQKIGGLNTFDPLDPAVKSWWTTKINEIYSLIPDFAGFTVKADSEGQPGPASFGRTPADAANTLAAALAPHNGVVLYRAFVYNHHADWRDPKADRARAAYDIFHPLDGKFASNVIIQTKEGPIDFQVREPVSPLFGGLTQTSQAMELQITQEYTGQQRHLVYLAPMWKQVLDFDMRAGGASTPVKQIISGKSFNRKLGGMVGVSGIGQQAWLSSPLALANLYAFGRLAWNPDLTSEQIADEWTRQTISNDPAAVRTVTKMLMQSWPAYENYTGPLGLQTLTDITGSHYGPNIESSENNGWGQWHRADHDGVGMDRSVATGTGFVGQYSPEVAKLYESATTTPDDLLLFFHHVPYTWKLHDRKTVIQYLYDSHYDGAAQAAQFVDEWTSLKARIDPELYNDMLPRLQYQAGHAIVWRDAITQYFLKLSGIPDAQGRAGHYPNRLEAEDAHLTGYKVIDVNPWEDASGGRAVNCDQNAKQPSCSAEWTYNAKAGRFNIAVQYFDLQGGTARFVLTINGQPPSPDASWSADGMFPTTRPHADNSTRHIVHNVALKPGDIVRVEGTPDRQDPAALDYIEILPATSENSGHS
ncbi:alpha-glucuronidase family glycosyl hydrolase [Telmatobacter sp. DSM 110680]|uniref:Xylan alpha-1,2-glucuronidase n=1 Tax=Telmatobacter sp. DSM 110680 TaxID=3036704 RepID=A0AAU7DM13_9BACT